MKNKISKHKKILNFEELKSLQINKLFGYKTVKIPLEEKALILVGDNGSGKTTVLKLLYDLLSFQFCKLADVDFESITIEPISGESLKISKEDIRRRDTDKYLQKKAGKSIYYFPARRIIKSEEINLVQRKLDYSFIKFSQACNEYLVGKKIIYDEAIEEGVVIEVKNNTPINIDKLSFAEKKIILIFSRVYLKHNKPFIALFDEPESSLMLEWQRRLLPDILKSNKCKFLVAMTHSPFIFDNELDKNARDLDVS